MCNKKCLLSTICLFILFHFCGPAAAQSKEESRVRQLLATQVQDWNQGDVAGFMQGYWNDDSLLFINKDGPQYGWQPVLDHFKKGYPNVEAMGELTFNGLILKRLTGEYYFVAGQWRLHRMSGDMGGQFTLLLRKIKGEWRIVVDHTS